MKIWKMNGAGNDFLIINNMEEQIPLDKIPAIAKLLCERHLSIGADGFMVVEKPSEGVEADYRMVFFNNDGSLGEMCGNGARCIARYGYENKLAGEIQRIETTAGIVVGEKITDRLYKVRLNDPSVIRLNETIQVDGKEMTASYVELGNPGIPHSVVPMQGLKEWDENELRELGRKIRFYQGYPKGANVNFYEVTGEDYIFERTFERGVEDFTYACGTGTGSMVMSAALLGEVSGNGVKVDVTGGQLIIDVLRDGDKVTDIYLTGPTNIVMKGEACDEDLYI